MNFVGNEMTVNDATKFNRREKKFALLLGMDESMDNGLRCHCWFSARIVVSEGQCRKDVENCWITGVLQRKVLIKDRLSAGNCKYF
jgi:hypothetical protein